TGVGSTVFFAGVACGAAGFWDLVLFFMISRAWFAGDRVASAIANSKPTAKLRRFFRSVTRNARPADMASIKNDRLNGDPRPCQSLHAGRPAEVRQAICAPFDRFHEGVPVGVPERITHDLPIGPRVVHEQVGAAVLGLRKAV